MNKQLKNKETIDRIEKERAKLTKAIRELNINSTESKFLLRNLANLTEKLLEATRNGK